MSVTAYIKYGAVSAKAKAMYAKRLRERDYTELLSRRSIPQITAFLRQTAYEQVLPQNDDRELHRKELEAALRQSLQQDLRRLKYFIGPNDKVLMNAYLSKNDLQYILSVIRYLRNKDATDKSSLFSMLSQTEFLSDGLDRLIGANDYTQFLSMLEQTAYAGLFTDTDFTALDYASAQVILTARFYSLFFRTAQKYLSAQNRAMLSRQIGTEIDLKNLSCILRLKQYFPTADMHKYMLPFGRLLRKERLTELIRSSDFFETLHQLAPGYCKYFSESEIDERKDLLLYQFDRSVILSAQPSVSVVLAYLALKDTEIRNIIHIIEGIRYGNDPDSIRKRLIGVE